MQNVAAGAGSVLLARLDFYEDLMRSLVEQEQAAEQENEVSPADADARQGE